MLAQVHYRESEFAESARIFQSVAAVLDSDDRQLAAEAQWLAAKSLIGLSRNDPRKSELAYSAIENLLRRFPDSSFAHRAEFEKLKLQISSVPGDEAIRRLSRIEERDPNYLLALPETVRISYQLWMDGFDSENSDRDRRFEELVAAERRVRNHPQVKSAEKLKSTLLVVDALLRCDPVDESQITSLLSVAEESAEPMGSQNLPAYIEYRYYQLLFADKKKDDTAAQNHAQWLVDHAANTRFERVALIYLGRLWDRRLSPTRRKRFGDTGASDCRISAIGGRTWFLSGGSATIKQRPGLPGQVGRTGKVDRQFPGSRSNLCGVDGLFSVAAAVHPWSGNNSNGARK